MTWNNLTESQQEKFNRLSEILRKENQIHNLTRITDPEEIRQRHFADSLAAVDIINKLAPRIEKPKIIDIGSGAGFPGLALAIAMPQIELTSVEATGKKINFQTKAAAELELTNVTTIQARAEELATFPRYRERYDFAVSRAVANLAILSELCLPFVEPGGYFLAWKGQKAQQEIDNAKKAIRALGGEISQITPYTLEENANESNLQIVVIRKTIPTLKKYPRPYKAIKQKPLGT